MKHKTLPAVLILAIVIQSGCIQVADSPVSKPAMSVEIASFASNAPTPTAAVTPKPAATVTPKPTAIPLALSVTGHTYPTVIEVGQTFILKGIVSSNHKLISLTAGIYAVSQTKYEKTVQPDTTSYDLSGINAAMLFNELTAGDYVYKVVAKDASGTEKVLINKPFVVMTDDQQKHLSWKQSDSRWGNIHLGNSSYQMKDSGCLVTSLAIAIYDLGYTENGTFTPGILVDMFNNKGGFTASGAYYWSTMSKVISGASSTVYGGNSIDKIRSNISGKNRVVICVNDGGHWVYVRIMSADGSILYVSDVGYPINSYKISEVTSFAIVHYDH